MDFATENPSRDWRENGDYFAAKFPKFFLVTEDKMEKLSEENMSAVKSATVLETMI